MNTCFVYCRKSSEDGLRQVQSIADQKRVMGNLAQDHQLTIARVFMDEKSAGYPGQRPGFNAMMDAIQEGEVKTILTWKIDRLSRNPIENGKISWLLQTGIIERIIASDRVYTPQDNVLPLLVEGAMANQYLRDLSRNVKRGQQGKIERGIYPSRAPFGYVNAGKYKGAKTIEPDSVIFGRIQKLWELLLTGSYQLADLYRIMTSDYPIYQVNRRGKSGKQFKVISFSSFHRIFHNPFYCGLFKWQGQLHLGSHQPMITKAEYEKAQRILVKKPQLRYSEMEFDYKGLFKCGNCSACITAERKHKFIKSTQEIKTFDYYRCAHKKRDVNCQEKPMSAKAIATQLKAEVSKLYLPDNLIAFGLDQLEEQTKIVQVSNLEKVKELKQAIANLEGQMQIITNNMMLESDIEIRHLMKNRLRQLKIDRQKLVEQQDHFEQNRIKAIENLTNILKIVRVAGSVLTSDDKEEKQKLVRALGENWQILGKSLQYEPHFLIKAIYTIKRRYASKIPWLEPDYANHNTVQLTFAQIAPVWRSIWELIRNRI